MTENNIRLIMLLTCAGLWLLVIVFFTVQIKMTKKKLVEAGKTVPPAESRLLMVLIISVFVIVLPYFIRCDSCFVSGRLEACGVMATWIGFQERLGSLKAALNKKEE